MAQTFDILCPVSDHLADLFVYKKQKKCPKTSAFVMLQYLEPSLFLSKTTLHHKKTPLKQSLDKQESVGVSVTVNLSINLRTLLPKRTGRL